MFFKKFLKKILNINTHANIAIVLNPKDINKKLYANDNNENHYIKTSYNLLEIYLHINDNLDITKKYLKNNLNTYEDVLQYILKGDRITLDIPYCEKKDEQWEDNKPFPVKFKDNLEEFLLDIPEEYYYIYNNGIWYYKYYIDDKLKKL